MACVCVAFRRAVLFRSPLSPRNEPRYATAPSGSRGLRQTVPPVVFVCCTNAVCSAKAVAAAEVLQDTAVEATGSEQRFQGIPQM